MWLLSRSLQSKLAAPLNDLTKAVHEVAYNQDYARQVEIVSDDELGELGSAFNFMLSKLAEHEEFRTEKELEIANFDKGLTIKSENHKILFADENTADIIYRRRIRSQNKQSFRS